MLDSVINSTQSEATPTATYSCRLSTDNGEFLAAGTVLVEAETESSGGFRATVQGLNPVGPVLLSIFGQGKKRFTLEFADEVPQSVELISSRWLDGGRRVCFFRSLSQVA